MVMPRAMHLTILIFDFLKKSFRGQNFVVVFSFNYIFFVTAPLLITQCFAFVTSSLFNQHFNDLFKCLKSYKLETFFSLKKKKIIMKLCFVQWLLVLGCPR